MNYLSAASLMRVVSVKQMHSKRSMDGASHQPDVALKASPPSDIKINQPQPSQEGPSGSLRMAALGLDGRARVALSARWRFRDGSHCGSRLCSIVRSRRAASPCLSATKSHSEITFYFPPPVSCSE